jgi:DNA modification methylase
MPETAPKESTMLLNHKITHANIKEWAATYDGPQFDGILCDPPYELGFMGKSWDSTGIAFDKDMWADLFRHVKPGGHLLAFSGSRTYHRMAVAIEDAGFEIRDMIEWVYGSGFPKSLNIGKAVDKMQGNEREVTGESSTGAGSYLHNETINDGRSEQAIANSMDMKNHTITKGTSPYEGYGTALKPAHEPCVLARKPLEKGMTVAQTALKHGTGGLNIDGSRVKTDDDIAKKYPNGPGGNTFGGADMKMDSWTQPTGRFPANLIHDGSDEVVGLFPQTSTHGGGKGSGEKADWGLSSRVVGNYRNDSGSAARFFFQARPDTLKYDTMSVCQCTNANSVINFLRTIQATTDNTARLSAVDLQDEQLDLNVKSVITGCKRCATHIVQELVRIKNLVSSPQGLTAFQHFTKSYKNDTPTQRLASLVEKWVSTDTTPTTTSLLTLFGCVLLAIEENTRQESRENNSDSFHLKYTAKASKRERNAGLEESNTHPTLKPLSLTKYLANLIKPPTGGRLLVPFSGSGSEMIGALQAGWEYVEGVELTAEYIPIAEARIKHWTSVEDKQQTELL